MAIGTDHCNAEDERLTVRSHLGPHICSESASTGPDGLTSAAGAILHVGDLSGCPKALDGE